MASANEELADRARVHAINLLRFDAKVRRDVLRQLERLEKDLIERLRLGAVAGDEAGTTLTPAQRQRLTTLLTGVTETIRTAYRGIDTETAGELAGLAVSEGEWTVRSLAGALGTDAVAVMPAPATLRSVAGDALVQGAPSREWWSRQAGDLVERFSDEVRQGIIAGETNSQIVRRIRGSRAAGFKDGIMEVTRRNAEALVRTSVQSVANDALMTTARENSDVVKGFEQISTLDSRTCFIAGTPVKTPDGERQIDTLKPGDIVIGGSGAPRIVMGTASNKSNKLVRVTLSNGKQVVCTADHLFMTNDGDWKQADELIAGESLSTKLK